MEQKAQKKSWKAVRYVALFLGLLLLALVIYGRVLLSWGIGYYIHRQTNKQLKASFTIGKIGFRKGEIQLYDVQIELIGRTQAKISSISVENLAWMSLLKGFLQAGSVCLAGVEAAVVPQNRSLTWDSLKAYLRQTSQFFAVDSIDVELTSFRLGDSLWVSGGRLRLYDIGDTSHWLGLKGFALSVAKVSYGNSIRASNLQTDSRQGFLNLGALEVERKGFKIKQIRTQILGLDFGRLVRTGHLALDTVAIERVSVWAKPSSESANPSQFLDSVVIRAVRVDTLEAQIYAAAYCQITGGWFLASGLNWGRKSAKRHPVSWLADLQAGASMVVFKGDFQVRAVDFEFMGLSKGIRSQSFNFVIGNKNSKIRAELKSGNLEINALDTRRLLLSRQFLASRFSMHAPNVRLLTRRKEGSTRVDEDEIRRMVGQWFNKVLIASVHLADMDIQSWRLKPDSVRLIGVNGLDLLGYGFEILPFAKPNKNKLLFFDELILSLHNFFLRHTDSTHVFEIGEFRVDSQKDEVIAQNVGFFPYHPNPNLKRYEARLKKLSLKGLQIRQMLNTGHFYSDSLIIESPELDLLNQSAPEKLHFPKLDSLVGKITGLRRGVFVATDSTKTIFDFLKSFKISFIELRNGLFSRYSDDSDSAEVILVPRINASMQEVELDSAKLSQRKLLITAERGFLNAQSLIWSAPRRKMYAQVRDIGISPLDSQLQIEHFRLISKDWGEVKIPQAHLKGVHYREFFLDTVWIVDELKMSRPCFRLTLYDSQTTNTIPFAIRKLSVEQADISAQLGKYAISGNPVWIRADSLWQSGVKEFWIQTGEWNLKSNDLSIGGDSVWLDNRKGGLRVVGLHSPFGYVQKIIVDSLNFNRLVQNRYLSANQIRLLNPELTLPQNDSTPKLSGFYPKVSRWMSGAQIRKVEVRNATMSLKNQKATLFRVNLDLKELNLDSIMPERLFDSRSFRIWGAGYSHYLPGQTSWVHIGPYHFDSQDSTLQINEISLEPEFAKEIFGFVSEKENWIAARLKHISLKKIDLHNFIRYRVLRAQDLEIGDARIVVYADELVWHRRYRKPLLQEILLSITPRFEIDTFEVKTGKVRYERMCFLTDSLGVVEVEDVQLSAQSIGNLGNNKIKINGAGYLQGEGRLEATVVMDLTDSLHKHYVGGILYAMNLENFNSILQPALSLKIKEKAACKQVYFDFTANRDFAIGQLTAVYRKLHIQRIDPKKLKIRMDDAMFNLLANSLVKNRNPRFLFTDQGKIYFLRDTTRSFISFWVRSLLEGVKTTVGLPPKHKLPRNLKNFIRNIKERRIRRSQIRHVFGRRR